MDQSHIDFVKTFYKRTKTFDPTAFFQHFSFKASAREFATNLLKEVVQKLETDDDENLSTWATRFASYDYQALDTLVIDQYWLGVLRSATETSQQVAKQQETCLRWETLTQQTYQNAQKDEHPKKKQKRQHSGNDQSSKASRSVNVQALNDVSQDSVAVSWSAITLGNIMLKNTKTFIEKSKKTNDDLIILAQNGILDLANRSNAGQKAIFEKEQWAELKLSHLCKKEKWEVTKEVDTIVKTLLTMAKRNIYDAIDDGRSILKSKQLNGDERNFFFFINKLFEIIERHPELFDAARNKELTENDFTVRLWSPLLFALFDDCRAINLTWGESVLRAQGDRSYYKVDLRIHFTIGKETHNLAVAEFAKDSMLSKLRADHVKLLLEGNAIISTLHKYQIKSEVALLQCAGTEAEVSYMKALDHHVSVATRSENTVNITSSFNPKKIIDMYGTFLQFKHTVIDLMSSVKESVDNSHVNAFDEAHSSQ